MRDLFEAIAEYMSAEGADARREHAKKVRIEFDLVHERMQEMQSLIEALEKDAEFLNWIADRIVNVYGESNNVDFVIKLRSIAAMQSEKVGV